MDEWLPDRSKFKDPVKGSYLTMMLFLETSTNIKRAVYTLADEDKTRNGVVYPSLRRLYLEEADPSEYEFANKYLWGWDHWQRIVANQVLYDTIRLWRDELEVKLRAKGIRAMIDLSDKNNFNAAKWVADGHWNVKRGRPSKEELEREKKLRERAMTAAEDDSERVVDMLEHQRKRKQ